MLAYQRFIGVGGNAINVGRKYRRRNWLLMAEKIVLNGFRFPLLKGGGGGYEIYRNNNSFVYTLVIIIITLWE
jgi:hypothetical protein